MPDPPTRRSFLAAAGAAAAGGATFLSGPLVRAQDGGGRAAPAVHIDPVVTISPRADAYHGWPTLAARSNGELLVVCSGGRESHVCPFGRVELMRSSDEGRTWSWPRVLFDGPIDDRDSGVVETASGAILVTTFTSLAYWDYALRDVERRIAAGETDAWPADRLARWRAAHNRLSEDQRQAQLGMWMMRSEDGGATFSAPYRTPVNSPHGPIRLADGRLLYAGKELWMPTQRIGVAESRDDGVSWRWLAQIPTRPGDSDAGYHELHAAEPEPGRLVVHIRNENAADGLTTLQSESNDGGRSWSVPRVITWGLPSHLLRLRDGSLLMSYGYRREPYGVRGRMSDDGGRSWSREIVLYDGGAGGDLGYPSTVELPGGDLLTVWYELMRGTSHAALRQARWRRA